MEGGDTGTGPWWGQWSERWFKEMVVWMDGGCAAGLE